MKNIVLIACTLLLGMTAFAQMDKDAKVANELIVMFQKEVSAQRFLAKYQERSSSQLRLKEQLSKSMNIVLIASDNAAYWLELWQNDVAVQFVQYNHYVQARTTPNDIKYTTWQADIMGKLEAGKAWKYTTGGLSMNGDTIVAAVIDGGFDFHHEDLADNVWKNRAEIPYNGLDDDNNGRVDDYYGWNVSKQSDAHDTTTSGAAKHGSSVAGIIGAKGNNGLGIAGVNWEVKLMLLSASGNDLATEAKIVQAYDYILDMRRSYNQSNGQKGAFVVTANLSFGVDFGKAEDYPIWCAIYDSLGAEGVLSVGATTNWSFNVDEDGDMPTSCLSDYLIAVNQSGLEDQDETTGYGAKNIDLSAPGKVYTTRPNNTYNVFDGTSGAAPHVTGTVALLYAYKDLNFGLLQKNDPAQAALLVKSMILGNVDKIDHFKGKTATGGRLNIGKAMEGLSEYYAEPSSNELLVIYPTLVEDQVAVKCALNNAHDLYYIYIYNMLGQRVATKVLSVDRPQIMRVEIDLSSQGTGVYVVEFRAGKKSTCQTVIKN